MPLATIGSPEGYNVDGSINPSSYSRNRSSIRKTSREDSSSSGWVPVGPALDGTSPGTPKDRRNFFGEILAIFTGFLDAQITIDTISSPNMMRDSGRPRAHYKPFLQEKAQRADQADPGNLRLPVLAYQSGGQVFEDDIDLVGVSPDA